MSKLRDALYDAAYRFKKSKLWNKLYDTKVFAVKLSDGEYGYVSIMGFIGEHYALGLYIGEDGFQSYRRVMSNDGKLSNFEILLMQDSLQLCFVSKEEMLPDELEEARAYNRKNDVRIGGYNAYPRFVRFRPDYVPWRVDKAEDAMALIKATEVSILLSKKLDDVGITALGLKEIDEYTKTVPLFDIANGELECCGSAPLPGDKKIKYEYTEAVNQTTIDAVKKLNHQGIWEAQFTRIPSPCQDSPEETPYYPCVLIMVDAGNEYMLPMPLSDGIYPDPQTFLWEYAKAWRNENSYPKEIRCADELTYSYLKDFSEKTGASISLYSGELPALADAKERFVRAMLIDHEEDDDEEDEAIEIAELALEMPFEAFSQLPNETLLMIYNTIDYLPEDLAERLEDRFDRL